MLFVGNSDEVIHEPEVASFAQGFLDTLFADKFVPRKEGAFNLGVYIIGLK